MSILNTTATKFRLTKAIELRLCNLGFVFYPFPLLQILAMQAKLNEQQKVITQLQVKKQDREAELKQEVSAELTWFFI